MNQSLLNSWIEDNGPYGHEKLSVKAGVSYPTIGEVRRGYVPSAHIIRKLCTATGYLIDQLFPLVAAKGKAS